MKNEAATTFSVSDLLSGRTVSDLTSIARKLKLKGYSGRKKSELIELIHSQVTNESFLESLLLICDRRPWTYILAASTAFSPTPIPDIALPPCEALADFGILYCREEQSGNSIMMPDEIKAIFARFSSNGFVERKMKSDLLDRYALAFIHLYGIISQDEFISIFNAQNSCKTDTDELFSVLNQHISADAPYRFWGKYLTNSLFEATEYRDAKDLLASIDGKQRYIPERAILLQYDDPNFYEETPEVGRVKRYLREKIGSAEQVAAEITSELVFACVVDASFDRAIRFLDDYNLHPSKSQIHDFIPLFVDMSNKTRKWSNCGFTPREMYQQKISKTFLRQGRKIGRNEPCPCGSGKKYKKCCGRYS